MRGLLWPSSTDVATLAYSPYLPLELYTPSLVHSIYLPLAMYMPSLAYLLYSTLAYLRCWLSCDGVWSLSHPANKNMNIWLLRGSSYVLPSHLSVIVVAPCNLTIRNDCPVVDVVSWHRGQSYCWHFTPSRLLMWLIHIDQKGWLLLVQSCLLVSINPHCCSLRYDKNNIIVVILSCNMTLRIDHCTSAMSSLQCISLLALCVFAIIACSLAMQHKKLVGCCMARSPVPLPQSTIIIVALCNTTSTLVATILGINIACCCHPCDQQLCIIWLLHPHVLQWLTYCCRTHACNATTSCNIKKYHCCRFPHDTTKVCSLSSLLAINSNEN